MTPSSRASQQGFLLVTVVLILGVLAAMALMLSSSASLDNALVAKHAEDETLGFVSESGLAHAEWQLAQNDTCTGYMDLSDTVFGEHSYSATVTPTSGSPVSVTATGTFSDGTTRARTRADVKTYQVATVVILQPGVEGADTFMSGNYSKVNVSYGAEDKIWVTGSAEYRGLLKFDLSSLPAAAKITGANLELYLESLGGSADTVNVYQMTQSWLEGSSSNPSDSTDGASWSRYDGVTPWATAGGDHESNAAANTDVTAIIDWYVWDVTGLVDRWVSGAEANNGVLLKGSGPLGNARFTSSDSIDATHRPKLAITYTCECGVPCVTPGSTLPIAHWMLDDGSGLSAIDSEGGHTGTLENGPVWAAGQVDGALEFDGADDYVEVPHDDALSLVQAMTFSAWINAQHFGAAYLAILSKDDPGNGKSNYWFGARQGEIVFGFWASGAFRTVETSGLNLQSGTWYHLAASFDNATAQVLLYLDGSQVHAGSIAFEPTPESANILIGNSVDGEYWNGFLDDVRIYDWALDGSEVEAISSGGGGGSSPGYTETYDPWSATNSHVWETVDLGPLGVPANAVVEVAVVNTNGVAELWGGVRAVGSTLERRLQLHEAESGGTDVMIMHVQTDALPHIEHYSEIASDVTFILLGYWESGAYVEAWDLFTAGSSGSWVTRDLGGYGVPSSSVVELLTSNRATATKNRGGVRGVGSSVERFFVIDEAEGGGVDTLTLLAKANTASQVQVYAESDSNMNFYLAGYWNESPGSYTESAEKPGIPSNSGIWENTNLSGLGVPANSIASIVMFNAQADTEAQLGVRAVGSSLPRVLDLQEAEGGGSDLASSHVNVNGSGQIEWYDENTEFHEFWVVGWWVLP